MVSRGVEPGRFVRFGCVCVLSSKQPGLTLSQRIPTDHDHAIGVVGADISLATLADFLARERVGRHGVTFIIDNNDRLVGYPRLDSVRRQVGDTITLATASEVGDPFVAQAVKLREAGAGDRFTAQLAGRTYLVAFTPLPRRFGKDWSIGVIADIGEEDRHVSPLAADPAPFPGCDEEFTRRAEALTPENVLAELKFQPHDLLRVISRTTGGKDYAQLRGSLDRLKSTIITTNIRVPRGNFDRRRDLGENSDLGLTLSEAKQLLARVQQALVAAQAHDHAVLRPDCSSCGGGCHIKDWRLHQVATLFGAVTVRLPRFRCVSCGHTRAVHQLAIALSVDTGAGPAASASFRPDALSCRRWRAGASSAGGGRNEPRDIARPYAQNRRATSRRPGGQAGGRGVGDHRHLGLDLHP